MKLSPERSGLQGSNDTSHTSGARPRSIRRIVRLKPKRHENLTTSLGRPNHDEDNETQIDTHDIIPLSLNERDGRNDKIRLCFEVCTVLCENVEDAKDFIFHLGGPPSDQRNSIEQFSRFFTIADHQGNAYRLKIRSKPLTVHGDTLQPPLFSGDLKIRRFTRDDGKVAIRISANLFLNVNRALNYQRVKLAKKQEGAIFLSLHPTERTPRIHDNVAPLALRPNEHDKARREYIMQVVAALWADVRRAAQVSNISGSGRVIVSGKPNGFSLREIETCWDIGGAGFDVNRAMDIITPIVREWGGRSGWEGNETSITTQLSCSERLVIYAKSDNRLRLEIRHRPTQGKQSYTAQSIRGVFALMDNFRKEAAGSINRLLVGLRAPQTPSARIWDTTAYAQEWGAYCGCCDASRTILRMLMRERRVFGGKHLEHIPSWPQIKRKACARGLLRFENGAYHVAMPDGAESNFTTFDNTSSFLGHNSETHPVSESPNSLTARRIVREWNQIPPSPPFCVDRCKPSP